MAELRRTKDTKHPKRVTQFVYDVPKEKPQDDDLDELFKQAKAVMNPETLSLILENCIQTANNLIVQNELLNGTPDCY